MSIWDKIFSIKKDGYTKYITIFGLKIKHTNRIKKLEEENQKLLYKIYKYCPNDKREEVLKDWYYEYTGEILDLENPQTFNEKIQWLKLYDSTPIKTRLADKYLVREWVKEKIGEEYLIPLLGVWDKVEDIDFDKLPKQFVLKCNHGCGYNIIVTDKSKLDINKTKKQINEWLMEDFAFKCGFEFHYSDIPRKIIAEEYISNGKDLYDYKIWCFNGKAMYIQFLSERKQNLKMAFYDTNWIKQDFVYSYEYDEKVIKKPESLKKLLLLAEKLSEGFLHVRVDFYILNNGDIKFGEMTFTSLSGTCKWNPQRSNKMLGDLIQM